MNKEEAKKHYLTVKKMYEGINCMQTAMREEEERLRRESPEDKQLELIVEDIKQISDLQKRAKTKLEIAAQIYRGM
jgi:hypothetical protein